MKTCSPIKRYHKTNALPFKPHVGVSILRLFFWFLGMSFGLTSLLVSSIDMTYSKIE